MAGNLSLGLTTAAVGDRRLRTRQMCSGLWYSTENTHDAEKKKDRQTAGYSSVQQTTDLYTSAWSFKSFAHTNKYCLYTIISTFLNMAIPTQLAERKLESKITILF